MKIKVRKVRDSGNWAWRCPERGCIANLMFVMVEVVSWRSAFDSAHQHALMHMSAPAPGTSFQVWPRQAGKTTATAHYNNIYQAMTLGAKQ